MLAGYNQDFADVVNTATHKNRLDDPTPRLDQGVMNVLLLLVDSLLLIVLRGVFLLHLPYVFGGSQISASQLRNQLCSVFQTEEFVAFVVAHAVKTMYMEFCISARVAAAVSTPAPPRVSGCVLKGWPVVECKRTVCRGSVCYSYKPYRHH